MTETIIKCPGRFSKTREKVFDAAKIVLTDKIVSEQDLIDIWDILQSGGDLFGLDGRDPYYDSPEDSARKISPQNYLSLVPLFQENILFLYKPGNNMLFPWEMTRVLHRNFQK